jgi:hypothetical protein
MMKDKNFRLTKRAKTMVALLKGKTANRNIFKAAMISAESTGADKRSMDKRPKA